MSTTEPRHLYVHVPFCARRCSYCDFAIAVRRRVPVDDFVEGIRSELAIRNLAGAGRPALDTMYLGGGTPSRLGPDGVARLFDVVAESFEVAPGAEVTIEANPEDVTPAAARAWTGAGVTRISLGVQSFDPAVLEWMHRSHDLEAVHGATSALRDEGVDNWSIDLIFGLPDGLQRDWRADIERAIALAPSHVSAYGLTVEAGTPLARWRDRGAVGESDEGRFGEEFLLADRLLGEAGYGHYEVSNYAMPGRRARHNSAYWTGATWLGVGPSAHGFNGTCRRWNAREYVRWLYLVQRGKDPLEGEEELDDAARELESTYFGLRTDRGVRTVPEDARVIAPWVAQGWGTVREDVLSLTPKGWLRLDALTAALTAHRSRC